MKYGTVKINPMTLSHELRIPLSGILGGVELLKMTDMLSDAQKEHLEIIQQSGNRLLTFVESITKNINKN